MENRVLRYTFENKNKIIEYNDKKVFIKPKKKYDIDYVYKYLDDHYIDNYLKPLEITDKEIIFPYLEKTTLTKDEKARKLILNLALWQTKTTSYQEVDLDKVKEIYEDKKNYLNYLDMYYHDLQDLIEKKVYMHPSEYLFIRKVSIIYQALKFSKELLEKWYQKMLEVKSERLVYCHGKLELNHFLENDYGYFISLEKACVGRVSSDISHFYKKHYNEVSFIELFNLYQNKFMFKEEEKLFFYLDIIIPDEINLYELSFEKTKEISNFYNYQEKTSKFILEEQEG